MVDTRELGRRPGSQRELRFAAPAPEELAVGMVGVPADATLELELRLESVVEGVLVSGRVVAPVAGECGRCLQPLETDVEVDLLELYAYPESEATEDEASRLDGDFLDLEPVLRDAVVLALPLRPLCDDSCLGLCATCGARLDDVGAGHRHDEADPRWAALEALMQNEDRTNSGQPARDEDEQE